MDMNSFAFASNPTDSDLSKLYLNLSSFSDEAADGCSSTSGSDDSFHASPTSQLNMVMETKMSVPDSAKDEASYDCDDTMLDSKADRNNYDMKKHRLARKAELARLNRRKKKDKLQSLEMEVARLKETLERERRARKLAEEKLHLLEARSDLTAAAAIASASSAHSSQASSSPSNPFAYIEDETKKYCTMLRQMLTEQSGTPANVAEVVSKLLDLTRQRIGVSASQVNTLRSSLELPLPLRFLEWVMNQSDSFLGDANGLWHVLCTKDMGMNPEQYAQLMKLRSDLQAQRATGLRVKQCYEDFCKSVEVFLFHSAANLEKVVQSLNPEQMSKFLGWCDMFASVCINVSVPRP